MLLIDEKVLINNPVLIERIKRILKNLIQGFTVIDYQDLKARMHPTYFDNLFYVVNKNLALVSRLVSKCKMNRIQANRDMSDNARLQIGVMQNLTKFIEDNTSQGSDLVALIVSLLSTSDNKEPKQKFDCFTNIRSYMSLYPEFILDKLDLILDDSYFTKPRNNWLVSDVNNILYFWIFTQKTIIKTPRGQGARSLLHLLKEEVLYKFIENIIGIIFDRRAFPNFVVNALHHLKSILDFVSTDLIKKL